MAGNSGSFSPTAGGRAATSVGKGGNFFLLMAVVFLLIVLIGFARTFYLRPFFDVPPISLTVYLHGALLTGWYALFVVQPLLIRTGRAAVHRKLGMVGAVLGLALVAVTFMTILGSAQSQLAAGKPIGLVASLTWMNFAFLLAFAVLLSAAIAFRRRSEAHKRLMFLASLGIIFPALVRFPNELIFGGATTFSLAVIGLMLAVLVAYDFLSRRRPHPATVLGASFVVLVIAAGKVVIGGTGFGQEIVRALG